MVDRIRLNPTNPIGRMRVLSNGGNPVVQKRWKFEDIREATRLAPQNLINKIKSYNPTADTEIIKIAFDSMLSFHRDEAFPDGEPYVFHQINVGNLLTEWKMNEYIVAAGLLHRVDPKEIEAKVSKKVSDLVRRKLNLEGFTYNLEAGKEQQRYCLNAMIVEEDNLDVHILEAADILQTILTCSTKMEFLQTKEIANRAIRLTAPFMDYIGYTDISQELEDIAFMHLDIEEYKRIEKFIDGHIKKSRFEAVKELKELENLILEELNKEKILTRSKSRLKRLFSTKEKLGKREVKDIYGMRFIVKTIRECYQVYGIISTILKDLGWEEDPGGYRNYITKPKENNYRSLHLRFLHDDKPLEVQIRTEEMDIVAEYGKASHLKYKREEAPEIDIKDPSAISRFKALRERLTKEGIVYAHDEKGNIYELKPSRPDLKPTVLDFAFATNTDNGIHFSSAILLEDATRIDTTYDKPVKNGSKIIIISSKRAFPTEERLRYANTPLAFTLIRRWLEEQKVEMPARGKTTANFIEIGKQTLEEKLVIFEKSAGEKLSKILSKLKVTNPIIAILYSVDDIARKLGLRTESDIHMKIAMNGDREACASEIINKLNDSFIVAGYRKEEIKSGAVNLYLIIRDKPELFLELTESLRKNKISLQSAVIERIEEGFTFLGLKIISKSESFYSLLENLKSIYGQIIPITHKFSSRTLSLEFKITRDKMGLAADIAKRILETGGNIIHGNISPLTICTFTLEVPIGKHEKTRQKLEKRLNEIGVIKIIRIS